MSKKRVTIGILAHVDAGKTTLSEGILFRCGAIRKAGRVDHGDAFLDTDAQEKERGITIYSKQAEFSLPTLDITLLDTPGHVDFSAEMERTLQVLDYAILVINGREGIQGHALTLWKLLQRYDLPAFAFINKMDLCARDGNLDEQKTRLMEDLRKHLGEACVDFDARDEEEIAMRDESALEEYLQEGSIGEETIAKAIAARRIVPCYFGSALKMEGIDALLEGLETYCWQPEPTAGSGSFCANVFKITRDPQGERLTHLKVLNGTLKTRMALDTGSEDGEEKINQIRVYSGEKYINMEEAEAGRVCAVTGLRGTYAGQLLTDEESAGTGMPKPQLEAALSYSILLPQGVNSHEAYQRLKELEEEDPQLRISWDQHSQEIQVHLMGQVQLEILHNIILDRFGMDVTFGEGRITYKETITKAIEGAGHFEPLRHYAEVHLLLEPLPEGSGIALDTRCSEDDLDKNWQRLIITHLLEREHIGTMIGAPISDIRITLLAGRAHLKHTEGGDFRQATYRALRQGLRKSLAAGQVKLLEPWYDFVLQVPQDMVGRAMSDIQRMGGNFDEPDGQVLTGSAPVSEMKDYAAEVAAYSRGFGNLTCRFCGYRECHNTDEVMRASDYDADRDVDNPADSVFCSHGAGHNIPWNEADAAMHIKTGWREKEEPENRPSEFKGNDSGAGKSSRAIDKELDEIFRRTYNTQRETKKRPNIEPRVIKAEKRKTRVYEELPEYLLVDGYNIIFAWDELRELAKENIDSAREALIEILSNYQGYHDCNVIAVFDAYKVKGGERHVEKSGNVTIVYTKEAETADTYIERTTYELSGKKYNVRVATSDRLEQMIIMGNDARKVSADDFKKEVEQVNEAIEQWIQRNLWKNKVEHPNKIVIDQKDDTEEREPR